jgi:hypothetical protein
MQYRVWWVSIPKPLPLPVFFIGVDVFHAPMVYDPRTKTRGRKASCAAVIVQAIEDEKEDSIKMFSKSFKRVGGQEFDLGDVIENTIAKAIKVLNIKPASAVVWRDGIGESAFELMATEEIAGVRRGLLGGGDLIDSEASPPDVPLSYIVCQKRIATKFFAKGIAGYSDGDLGAPSGTMVKDIQGMHHQTFYINGRAPPFSTPKPTRFIVVVRDEQLREVPLAELTWQECHSYPNWPGPIKVPAVTQMAHKLAELAGSFADCGEAIDADKLANTIHFL